MDEWRFRDAPNGPGVWESAEVPVFEEPPNPTQIGRAQRGRDAKGRYRTGPQGFMDDADVLAYSQGSDIGLFDANPDEDMLRYWAGEETWKPFL